MGRLCHVPYSSTGHMPKGAIFPAFAFDKRTKHYFTPFLMKIYFRHHSGWEFSFQYQPLEKDKFYILAALASFAMLLATMLLWEFWR